MANGTKQQQGVGSFGFPSFGGPAIPQLQLRPASINFPRPSSGGGRSSSNKTALAGLLPYGIEALANRFGTTRTPQSTAPAPLPLEGRKGVTRADIDQNIISTADYLADQLYGPEIKEEKNLLGKIAPFASFLGAAAFDDPSEQAAYVKSYGDIASNRAVTKDEPKSKYRADFIKAQMGRTYGVAPAYMIGDETRARNAIKSPNGQFFIHSKGEDVDRDVDGNQIEAGKYYVSPEWIVGEPPTADLTQFSSSSNNAEKEFVKARTDVENTSDMLLSALPAINTVLSTLVQSPEVATWYSPINRILTEVTTFGETLYKEDKELYELAEKDGRITWYKPSEGLRDTSNIMDTSQDSFTYRDEVADIKTGEIKEINRKFSWEAEFGDIAQDAAFRSAVLNMAYVAAASTGNTGKALSDRDLALHLIQLGAPFEGGGVKDPKAVFRAMTTWYGDQLRRLDKRAKSLETGSLAADYRRMFNQPTPWAEKWIEGDPDDKNIRKIISPTISWIRGQDPDFYKYIETMFAAQQHPKFGPTSIPQDPIVGFDWQEYLRTKMTSPIPQGAPSGTVPIPPPNSRIFNPPPKPTT